MKLTEDQTWLLADLAYVNRWVRPMDLGGRDGSNHSNILRQLERKGLVESKQRGPNGARGSKLYRATAAGRTLANPDGEQT